MPASPVEHPSPPDLPPELANHPRYRILRELGRGGMGVVYLAQQLLMNRQVVVKVISKALLDQPDALERFRREVESAAKLAHPNIVTAHDAEQAGDLHMLVMEYVEGQSLDQVLRRKGPLPLLHACVYARQAALGLQHAHERGMVHRDIKPHNLMLTPKGHIKILDFGLAKMVSEQNQGQTALTALNSYMGTPDYSAPEQATDARKADIRADIYSLGCTLYCLLAGRPPFREETPVQTILAHLEKEPTPLPELRPDVPAALWTVVARMLAKQPAQRYQTPAEVAQALAPFVKAGQKAAPPSVAVPPDLGSPDRGTMVARPVGRTPPSLKQPVPAPERAAATAPLGGAAAPIPSKKRKARSAKPKGRRKRWPLLAGGAAGLLLLLVLAGAAVLLRARNGTVLLEDLPPDAEVFVDGSKVAVTSPRSGEPVSISVPRGQHQLKIAIAGVEVAAEQVSVGWGRANPRMITLPQDAGKVLVLDLGGGVKMDFVRVPHGTFTMGSPEGEEGRQDDEAPHEVEIGGDFYLGRYEVTRGQFQAFAKEDGYQTQAELDGLGGGGYDEQTNTLVDGPAFDPDTGQHTGGQATTYSWRKPGFAQTDDHPVVNVSWNDAQAFCRWLARRSGQAIRLPTEAEWEYACRAGTRTRFVNGDDAETLARVANVKDGTAKKKFPDWDTITAEDGYVFTAPIGRFQPNGFGLYDVHGNVWEWCQDRYSKDYYQNSPKKDPQGPEDGVARVLRGGSWGYLPEGCRAAYRHKAAPAARDYGLGFRVAFSPQASPPESPARPAATIPAYPHGGTWRIEGDALIQDTANADLSFLFFGDPSWTDYEVTVRAQRIQGDGLGWVVFRCEDVLNYWAFGGWGPGDHQGTIIRMDGTVKPAQVVAWTADDASHRLVVKVHGEHLQCLMDDAVVSDLHDERHPRGYVALATTHTSTRFRDLRVTDGAGHVLVEGVRSLDIVGKASQMAAEDTVTKDTTWKGTLREEKSGLEHDLLIRIGKREGATFEGQLWIDQETKGLKIAGNADALGNISWRPTEVLASPEGWFPDVCTTIMTGTVKGKRMRLHAVYLQHDGFSVELRVTREN